MQILVITKNMNKGEIPVSILGNSNVIFHGEKTFWIFV